MPYLIAYDIANPRRLRRVARLLEKHATRCQKSVFLIRAGVDRVRQILDQILPLLKPSTDCVQAWELARGQSLQGLVLGNAQPLEPRCVVSEPSSLHFIEEAADVPL